MRLGELKAESWRLMVLQPFGNISSLDINALKNNPTYSGYLYAQIGAINRALNRFFVVGVIPYCVRISAETDEQINLNEFAIPDELAELIPYFVAGELLAVEEPSLSANMLNRFELLLEEYTSCRTQKAVEVLYQVEC